MSKVASGNQGLSSLPSSEEQSFLSKWWWAVLFSIAIIGIIIVTVSISDSQDLPLTIIGAVLGVAMTVFATFFLFKGQAKQQAELASQQSVLQSEMLKQQNHIEREGEKETEIFKQKLSNYQAFLSALSEYLSSKERSAKIKLKFQTAALAMHAGYSNLAAVNSIVKTIIDGNNGEEMDDRELIPALFNLSQIFRDELYGKKDAKEDVKDKENSEGFLRFKESIVSFADAIEDSDEEVDKSEIEAEDAQEAVDAKEESVENWEEYVNGLKGWSVSYKKGNIILVNEETPALIEFKLKSGYYVVASSYGDDKEYPKYLQKDIKTSSRSGVNWWRSLNTLRNYRVKSGELVDNLSSNEAARALVMRWINRLTTLADDYNPKKS